MTRSYEIDPRPPELGGGWRLRLIEDGEEAGGGAFPAADTAADNDAYADALDEGEAWLQCQPSHDELVARTMQAVGLGPGH